MTARKRLPTPWIRSKSAKTVIGKDWSTFHLGCGRLAICSPRRSLRLHLSRAVAHGTPNEAPSSDELQAERDAWGRAGQGGWDGRFLHGVLRYFLPQV